MTEPEFETLSEEFTELNKQYNHAVKNGTLTLTDEIELAFIRKEREIKAAQKQLNGGA